MFHLLEMHNNSDGENCKRYYDVSMKTGGGGWRLAI
jgi:hypothetical protein